MMPSRKFILACLLSLLIGVGGFWLFKNKKTEIKPPFQKEKSFISGLFQKNQGDSDNDGLRDWEEILWKTDLYNPDTDGDGATDKEEVRAGRNPLKVGPDDKLESAKIFSQGSSAGGAAGLTQTDILARDFFTSFLALRESGNLNEDAVNKLADSFLGNISQQQPEKRYKISDLQIVGKEDENTLKNYGNALGEIIKKYYGLRKEEELIIINLALETENESELRKLDSIIKLYQGASSELVKVEVPQPVSFEHLVIVGSVWNVGEALKLIENIFSDSIQGLIGLKQYQMELTEANDALENISNYFTKKGVFFGENEAGYIFINNRQK